MDGESIAIEAEGGADMITELIKHKWDHVFFTGTFPTHNTHTHTHTHLLTHQRTKNANALAALCEVLDVG